MRRTNFCRFISTGLLVILITCSFIFLPASAKDIKNRKKIVIVGDVSQSIVGDTASSYLSNALKLSADLAPNDCDIALITVDTEIKFDSNFLSLSDSANREYIKKAIDESTFDGGTNLVLGIESAISKFGRSPGRIVMIADISDNALTRAGNFDEMTERANIALQTAKKNGIVVDLILVGTPDKGSGLVNAYLSIPTSTGGSIYYADSAAELAPAVEKLYFDSYSYNISPITGINSTDKEQQIDVVLPTPGIARSRIYVSATTPVDGIRATYSTAELGAEINPTYSMIDLNHPAREGITVYLDTGKSTSTKVYLIADYETKVVIDSRNELVKSDNKTIQKAVINLGLVDVASEKAIFTEGDRASYSPDITLISPGGAEEKPIFTPSESDDSAYSAEFYPKEYGTYIIKGSITGNDLTFPISETDFDILELPPQKAWLKPTVLSVIVGLLIITLAIIYYILSKRKRSSVNQSAVELDRVYGFTGKLHLSTILAEGGKREVQPFTFYLEKAGGQKRISLEEIYRAGQSPDSFPSMNKIWVTPGPRESIVIKNNSNAVILHSGKEYGYREKLQLFYNDKIYIVFKKDEDEIELYYKQYRPARSNVTGSKISVSVS